VSLSGVLLLGKVALEIGDLVDVWEALFSTLAKPSWGEWVLMAIIVCGASFAIKTARDPIDPGDEMRHGDVEKLLREARAPSRRFWRQAPRLFSDEQIADVIEGRPVVDRCYAHFQDQGIFTVAEARKLLRSRWLYQALQRDYCDILRRPADAFTEPDGYVHWGAMGWAAGYLERPDMRRWVKRRMEVYAARGAR
jgi:hypothetical protein